jgi:hypothetical protein
MEGKQLRFSVISKDPIDMETISVTVPVSYETELMVFQRELKRETEWTTGVYSDEVFPYYLYQAYRGIDFTDEKQQDAVLEDFKRLNPEHLPEFYGYTLVVIFPNNDVIEEPGTIEYADITIEGETYRVDPGNVRLHTEEEDPVIDYMDLMTNDRTGTGEYQKLYSDGALRLTPILNYRAEKETVLSRIYMVNEGFEIMGIEVSTPPNDNHDPRDYLDGDADLPDSAKSLTAEDKKRISDLNAAMRDKQAAENAYEAGKYE